MTEPEPSPDASPVTGPADGTSRRTVVRGLGVSSIGYPIGYALVFFGPVLAARALTRDEFGTFSLAVSIFSTVALIAQLGIPHSLLRRASAAISAGSDAATRNEVVSAFVIGTVAALVVAGFGLLPVGRDVLDHVFSETGVGALAALIGLRIGVRILENIAPEALRAFRDFFRVSLYDGLLANFLFVVTLAVVLVADLDVNASDVVLLSLVTAVVAFVPAAWSIHRKLRGLAHERLRLHNPIEPAMWLSTIGRAVLAQLDLLVVGILATSGQVATYAVPFRLALLVGFPLILVNQVVPPLIASWHAGKAVDRLERTLRATAGLAFLGAVGVGLGFVVLGRPIIEVLFGHAYVDGYGVLCILVCGQVAQTYLGSCGFALMMTDNQRVYSWILTVSTVVTAGLDVIGWHLWGLEGVAVATAVSLTVQNVVQAWVLKRLTGFSSVADLRLTLTEGVATLRNLRSRRTTS